MRVKKIITLPQELLASIDKEATNRSAFVERAVWQLLFQIRDARDIAIINANLEYLNSEAEDCLGYQTIPWTDGRKRSR